MGEGDHHHNQRSSAIQRNLEGKNLVVRTYWPEENRTSEAEILKKAEVQEYGRKIDLIIPEMDCHLDPNFLCSPTMDVRQCLGFSTDGSGHLRIIFFRDLQPIDELKEKDMLTAYLQYLFYK